MSVRDRFESRADKRHDRPIPSLIGRCVRVRLPVHPSSASTARDHLARLLTDWGLDVLTDTAQLVLTELITNAGKATVGYYDLTDPDRDDEHSLLHEMLTASDETIEVDVYRSGSAMVLAVWDRLRTPPIRKEADADDIGGRGLELINELAANWGYWWPSTGGKVVWATLNAPAA